MLKSTHTRPHTTPRIMYIDMAYTINMVRERGLDQELNARECGGYFEHVWGVHPIANIPEGRTLAYDGFKVDVIEFSPTQTLIEGSSEYYSFLKKIFPLNFFVSQVRFIRYLVSLVKKEKISIVITTDPYLAGLIGLSIKWFTKARFAIWVVSNPDDIYKATRQAAMPRLFKKRWIEKIIEQIVFRGADLVAGGNQNNLEFALRNGAKLSKSTVFPVGKLIHRQHQVERHLREKDSFFDSSSADYHFIFIGRLVEVKHPEDVIRAFAEIDHRVPGRCAMLMAGDGPMQEELETLADELNIRDKVFFLGNVGQLRLANLLAGCFAVLSPLTGRSLIESALAGLPLIAYDRDWQLDFIGKNNAGVIVPFRDFKAMGEAAVHLIERPDQSKKMGEASRIAGLNICNLERIYGHEKAEFEKLLQR